MQARKKIKKHSIVAVDVFCGVGGLTYGLSKAGVIVKAGIDVDARCKYAFEANNAAIFVHKSIKKVSSQEISRFYPSGSIKVLVGCAPCQPFSKHTQKVRKKKTRQSEENWGLLYHFLNTIKAVKPKIVSMENVPQLAKHKVFTDFVAGLKAAKYHVSWKSVYCPAYGIPQKRTRMVLLASKYGNIELVPPTHAQKKYRTVKMAIGRLEAIGAGAVSKDDRLHRAAKLSDINLKRMQKSLPGGSWQDWDEDLRADCHLKDSGETYSSVYARMEWNKPSPTITTQFFSFGTGRFGHPKQDRALSIREGAILQTFPKKYRFVPASSPVPLKTLGRYIGNAVPVRLGEVIGKSIVKHVSQHA